MQNHLKLTIICYFLDRDLMHSHNLVSIPITKTLDPAMLWVTDKLSNLSLKVLNTISKKNMADHRNNFTKRLKTDYIRLHFNYSSWYSYYIKTIIHQNMPLSYYSRDSISGCIAWTIEYSRSACWCLWYSCNWFNTPARSESSLFILKFTFFFATSFLVFNHVIFYCRFLEWCF